MFSLIVYRFDPIPTVIVIAALLVSTVNDLGVLTNQISASPRSCRVG